MDLERFNLNVLIKVNFNQELENANLNSICQDLAGKDSAYFYRCFLKVD